MTSSTSLLDWILGVLRDPEQRAEFQANPEAYAADHGFGDLSAADVHDALCLIADNQSASYDHDGDHHVHYPPPHRYDHDDDDAGHYLNNYISNNYKIIDDRDTIIDQSIHQDIDTDGGDFDQTIDNDPVVASGDGAVAAGDDIEDSTVTTGDGNVVGDDNQAVTGDDNTTAFGSGDATSANFDDTRLGDGSAISVGGDASGSSEDNDTSVDVDSDGSGSTAVNTAGDHGYADQDADQSETDSSSHSSWEDNSDSDSHDDINSHNSSRVEDSHNVDVHHA